MIGENLTPYPAILLTTVLDEERMGASMIVRVTFDIVDDQLVPATNQPWIVSVDQWLSPLGPFDPDQPYRLEGVDVLVHGHACAPHGEPVQEVQLSVAIDDFVASAVAIGPRVWRKGLTGTLVPSDPQPFVSLPVGLEAAFGGGGKLDGQPYSYPLNPLGKGFYRDESEALHQPLPEIEDALARIKKWDDRPEPMGFGLCQYPHPLRLQDCVNIADVQKSIFDRPISHRMFNRAFPKAIAKNVKDGALVKVTGFSPDGPTRIRIPRTSLRVRIELGDKVIERTPTIDTVGIDTISRRIFLGYRYPFRYVYVAHQRRRTTLLLAED